MSRNPAALWNTRVQNRAHKTLSLDWILGYFNPVHVLTQVVSVRSL